LFTIEHRKSSFWNVAEKLPGCRCPVSRKDLEFCLLGPGQREVIAEQLLARLREYRVHGGSRKRYGLGTPFQPTPFQLKQKCDDLNVMWQRCILPHALTAASCLLCLLSRAGVCADRDAAQYVNAFAELQERLDVARRLVGNWMRIGRGKAGFTLTSWLAEHCLCGQYITLVHLALV
jgi:hypothetical protein